MYNIYDYVAFQHQFDQILKNGRPRKQDFFFFFFFIILQERQKTNT